MMKKSMLALATALTLLTTGAAFAQGYDPRYNKYPTPNQQRYDAVQDEIRVDRLDAIVGLSRKQERELRRIEERYDRMGLTVGGRLAPRDYQRLSYQKNVEVVGVLTPAQRNRLYAFQSTNDNNRRGGNGNGRGNYGPYGRRG